MLNKINKIDFVKLNPVFSLFNVLSNFYALLALYLYCYYYSLNDLLEIALLYAKTFKKSGFKKKIII
jgi:hypothetical protein